MQIDNGCPICGIGWQSLRKFSARGHETLDLVRCSQCGLEGLWPQPSESWLNEQYQKYYRRRSQGLTHPKIEHFRALIGGLNLKLEGCRILELGPGEGDCLRALRMIYPQAQLVTVEKNSEAKEPLKQIDCQYFNDSLEHWCEEYSGDQFDLILMFDVLEHLRSPVETLKILKQKFLRAQGHLVVTVPLVDSLSQRILGESWPHYKLEHLYYFSRESLRRLEDQLGFQRVKLTTLRKKLPLGYWLNVGAESGPEISRKWTALFKRFLPPSLHGRLLTVPFGEGLWVVKG